MSFSLIINTPSLSLSPPSRYTQTLRQPDTHIHTHTQTHTHTHARAHTHIYRGIQTMGQTGSKAERINLLRFLQLSDTYQKSVMSGSVTDRYSCIRRVDKNLLFLLHMYLWVGNKQHKFTRIPPIHSSPQLHLLNLLFSGLLQFFFFF